jgi:hypothetical protein
MIPLKALFYPLHVFFPSGNNEYMLDLRQVPKNRLYGM